MRKFFKKITNPILKTIFKWYYYKPRTYKFEGIKILVHPEVFPPHFTFSTKILLNFLKTIEIKGKTFLELGCGNGIISLYASKKGANVTASDINETALDYLKNSAKTNQLEIEILYSDLFENLINRTFDYIIINPPYYPKKPKNIKELAWFCGSDFEYFENLFSQLQNQLITNSNCFLILSEDCNIEKINSIAKNNKCNLILIETHKNWLETNYIFKVEKLTF